MSAEKHRWTSPSNRTSPTQIDVPDNTPSTAESLKFPSTSLLKIFILEFSLSISGADIGTAKIDSMYGHWWTDLSSFDWLEVSAVYFYEECQLWRLQSISLSANVLHSENLNDRDYLVKAVLLINDQRQQTSMKDFQNNNRLLTWHASYAH